MTNKIFTHQIRGMKNTKKISALTAYDYITATILDELGIDIILVGDSLANIVLGYDNTLAVNMHNMLYHTKAVSKGVKRAMVVADMPFLSYQIEKKEAIKNAGLLMKNAGADAVKVEVTSEDTNTIEAIIKAGIPVMGHIGFTPQSVNQLGGYRIQGKTKNESLRLIRIAKKLEKVGCFAIVLEMMKKEVAKEITNSIDIPTIGIGAGKDCDGQILVTQDMLGLSVTDKVPKFVKKYANLTYDIKKAIKKYIYDVENNIFPDLETSY